MCKNGVWLFGSKRQFSGLFLLWNILLRLFLPVETFIVTPTVLHHHHHRRHSHNYNKKYQNINSQHWIPNKFPEKQMTHYTIIQQVRPVPLSSMENFPLQPVKKNVPWDDTFSLKKQSSCNGKDNFVQDLGVLAIVLGAVGTLMGIISASYYSVVGNTISVISGLVSYATGLPSAVITYISASDRLSYTIANVLSLISIANTAYSFWSVDFGNKDILLSQTANLIGVISLVLSIVTAFPKVFDALIYEITNKYPETKREVYHFMRNYGCDGDKPTWYEYSQQVLRHLATL